jgi:hypothetical protein
MADLQGSCIIKSANSGTLTVEIHLSPTTPQVVIQQILALVVAPQEREGRIHNATVAINAGITVKASPDIQVKLIPVEGKTGKWSLPSGLRVLLFVVELAFYVSGTADQTIQFLDHYRSYFQTKVNGSVVPIDQAKETIKNAEQPQPTPKNEQPEKSGNPSATSSEGD